MVRASSIGRRYKSIIRGVVDNLEDNEEKNEKIIRLNKSIPYLDLVLEKLKDNPELLNKYFDDDSNITNIWEIIQDLERQNIITLDEKKLTNLKLPRNTVNRGTILSIVNTPMIIDLDNGKSQTYQMPLQTYQMPRRTYQVPRQTYQVPRQTYQVPRQTYQMPRQTYQMPRQTYQMPRQTYQVPRHQQQMYPLQYTYPQSQQTQLHKTHQSPKQYPRTMLQDQPIQPIQQMKTYVNHSQAKQAPHVSNVVNDVIPKEQIGPRVLEAIPLSQGALERIANKKEWKEKITKLYNEGYYNEGGSHLYKKRANKIKESKLMFTNLLKSCDYIKYKKHLYVKYNNYLLSVPMLIVYIKYKRERRPKTKGKK
jgi:hypothetical protein